MERLIFYDSEISIIMLDFGLPLFRISTEEIPTLGKLFWQLFHGCLDYYFLQIFFFFLSAVVCFDDIFKKLKIYSDFLIDFKSNFIFI